MLLWCGVGEDSWTARRSNQSILKEISPEYSLEGLMLKLQYVVHLMWRTYTLEKILMLGKIEGRRRRGWDGWMASLTQWTWVWVSSGSWWWIGRPGVLQSMGSQRVGHDWATELKAMTIWLEPVSVINQMHIHACALNGLGDTTRSQYALLYVSVRVFHSSGFYLLHFSAWCLLFCCCPNLLAGQMHVKTNFLEDQLFFSFLMLFIYLFLAVLSLCCCAGFPLVQRVEAPLEL